MNWNSAILIAGFGLLGFLGKEMYTEVRLTHDAVIIMRSQFDLEVVGLKQRMAAIEVDIQKLKERNTNAR